MPNPMCTVPGCVKPARSKSASLCPMHYHRQYRHSSTNARAPRLTPVDRPHYRSSYRPGHPLAGRNGKVYVHRAVLYDAIGPGPHACHWCGADLDWLPRGDRRSLQADHLDGNRFNNEPANLVPACSSCNTARAMQARSQTLRALGYWSNHDTIARLRRGGRRPLVEPGGSSQCDNGQPLPNAG